MWSPPTWFSSSHQEQRYEGASTIYGPHTLQAYIQEFDKMAVAMAKVSAALLSTADVHSLRCKEIAKNVCSA